MTVRRGERAVDAALALFLGLELVTCFVGIFMLERGRPGLDAAWHSSDVRSDAAARGLALMARIKDTRDLGQAKEFDAVVRVLRDETPGSGASTVDEVERAGPFALAGDAAATERTVHALLEIAKDARHSADQAQARAAMRLRAASWVLVFLGGLGLWLTAGLRGRLKRRLLGPLVEFERVINAVVDGELRVRASADGGDTLGARTLGRLNVLLDRWQKLAAAESDDAASAPRLLAAMLDAQPGARLITDHRGGIVAASGTAIELLSSELGEAYRKALEAAVTSQVSIPGVRREPLGDCAWLCTLSELPR